MKKANILVDLSNIRVKYNAIGINYQKSMNSKHLRMSDLLDKSTQYKNSYKIANSYAKTDYTKIDFINDNKWVKLDKAITQLKYMNRHDKHNYTFKIYEHSIEITIDNEPQVYPIRHTNECLLHNNKLDYKQYKKLYK